MEINALGLSIKDSEKGIEKLNILLSNFQIYY